MLLGLGLIVFITVAARLMTRHSMVQSPAGGSPAGYGAGNRQSAYPMPLALGGGGAGSQPGLGSRVVNGLATGAAVGAGVVAGEALMQHLSGGNGGYAPPVQAFPADEWERQAPATGSDDLSGTDFGIADTSSWDNSDSGSDWN